MCPEPRSWTQPWATYQTYQDSDSQNINKKTVNKIKAYDLKSEIEGPGSCRVFPERGVGSELGRLERKTGRLILVLGHGMGEFQDEERERE